MGSRICATRFGLVSLVTKTCDGPDLDRRASDDSASVTPNGFRSAWSARNSPTFSHATSEPSDAVQRPRLLIKGAGAAFVRI